MKECVWVGASENLRRSDTVDLFAYARTYAYAQTQSIDLIVD
jgi:hypothetical protein